MAPNAIQAVVDGLAAYLSSQVSGLTVLKEWPSANQTLSFPSLTIFSSQPTYVNMQPEQIDVTDPDTNGQTVATLIVGEYDFKLQLDLWCATKVQRDQVMGQVMDAINSAAVDSSGSNNAMGLSLQLANYYNTWVRFDVDTHGYVDDAAAAQRQERRAKISLLGNCKAIKQRTYYAIATIEVHSGVGEQIPLSNDLVGTV